MDTNKIAEEAADHLDNALDLGFTTKERTRAIRIIQAAIEEVVIHACQSISGITPGTRAAHASEELIDLILGDLVRETNIFPNQIARAKQLIRERLSVKKKVMNAGLKKVEK